MAARDILEMAGNAAVGLSALVVALLAFLGLNTWRKKSRSEAAQKVIGLAKKAVTELQATRTIITYSGEAFQRPRDPNESDEERRVRDEQYARMKRMQRPQQTIWQLFEEGWKTEALLGVDLESYLAPISEQYSKIIRAIEILFMTDSAGRPVKRKEGRDTYEEWMAVYGKGAENDTVTSALEAAMSRLKKKLKRYV